MFESIYSTIILNIQKSLGKGLDRNTHSAIDHTISSYIKLRKELDHRRKGLINIQNIDGNECFKWSNARYLNTPDHNPARITKADKEFAKTLYLKTKKFQ